jgi:hypothetical protein
LQNGYHASSPPSSSFAIGFTSITFNNISIQLVYSRSTSFVHNFSYISHNRLIGVTNGVKLIKNHRFGIIQAAA